MIACWIGRVFMILGAIALAVFIAEQILEVVHKKLRAQTAFLRFLAEEHRKRMEKKRKEQSR